MKPYYRDYSENVLSFESHKDSGPPPFKVLLTEVMELHYPRSWKFDEANKKEIERLLARKTWKIVCRNEVPDDANILTRIFALAIKNQGTNKEIWKACFVVQRPRDKLKNHLVHKISVAKQQTTKILIGIAAIFGFRMFSTDVTPVYIQSIENLKRYIYIY